VTGVWISRSGSIHFFVIIMGKVQLQSFTEKNTKAVGDGSSTVGNGKLVVNKVTNYMSSICGSNSSDFDKYVGGRKRERDRLDNIELEAKKQKEEEEFAEKVLRNKQECEERTKKNALKRKRKKENQKKNRQAHAGEEKGSESNNSGGSDNEDGDANMPESGAVASAVGSDNA
jgi:hypothetical protein